MGSRASMTMSAWVISQVRRWTRTVRAVLGERLEQRLGGLPRAGFGRVVGAQIAEHVPALLDVGRRPGGTLATDEVRSEPLGTGDGRGFTSGAPCSRVGASPESVPERHDMRRCP